MDRPLPSEMTDEQLRDRTAEYRRMAATASTVEIRDALLRLAERFERLTVQQEQTGLCD